MPLLLLHGDNSVEIGEAVRAARQPFHPADILTYDGATAPLAALAEASRTAGLFDPQRLVIVHNVHERSKGARRDTGSQAEIEEILTNVAPSTTLLLVCAGMQADHVLLPLVKAAGGSVRTFTTPRRQELPRWIVARGRQRGIAVDSDAADLLAELVGANPVMIDSEIDKLATYAGQGERVTPAIVDMLVGAVPQESVFSLVDAVAAGNKPMAFRLLHAQLDSASANGIDVALYLIRMLARQIRILLRIRLGQQGGRTTAQITADLKLPRYFADRYFRQAKRLSTQRLTDAFEQLAALEYGLKSGRLDAATGLDLLVAELCS